jgi:hypothetical protein
VEQDDFNEKEHLCGVLFSVVSDKCCKKKNRVTGSFVVYAAAIAQMPLAELL